MAWGRAIENVAQHVIRKKPQLAAESLHTSVYFITFTEHESTSKALAYRSLTLVGGE